LPIFGRIAIFQMISSKIIRRFCQAETWNYSIHRLK
jgi:hypothetical protein